MHGAVISEYFPGTKPFQEYFRQRNRLISGLSLGVLIAEASSTSGALNTASHALQQGKDIFCVITSYSIHYTKLYEFTRFMARSWKKPSHSSSGEKKGTNAISVPLTGTARSWSSRFRTISPSRSSPSVFCQTA